MKEKILFKTLSGSKLYGTNSLNSDTDIKGVFLPDINDLILGIAPKHYQFSTGNDHNKNSKDDVDETYYSLQYFMELLSKGDTNALDMIFASSNTEAVLETSDTWKELVENKDKIITKNLKAYLGYCKTQSQKYSIKGEKINNFNSFLKMCDLYYNDKNKCGESATLYNILCKAMHRDSLEDLIPKPNENKIKVICSEFSAYNFGDNCYMLNENGNSCIMINNVKFSLKDSIKSAYDKCNKVIESYGKRAKAVAENGVDFKALSHAVRVLFQSEELLKNGEIVFPLKEADFIKSIKYNTTDMSYDDIISFIDKKIKEIDILLKSSKMREVSDKKWMNEFILKQYKDKDND